jgi:hypothetical protein
MSVVFVASQYPSEISYMPSVIDSGSEPAQASMCVKDGLDDDIPITCRGT